MINRVLNNRYEIIELVGRGGMAYVYKAKDLKLNRNVAVKVLREEYAENEQFIRKFDRESQAAAGLSHPNIVSVYDVGVEGDIYYIIMEYVDGITLKQYLTKKGRLDYDEATRLIISVANALKCAHMHKIIHRDIKPHNILLTRDLVPKVADFGIARAITSSTITMTNQTMGSVHYISPEQARGGFVDERSDLYSLGIMYYELVTGKVPFDEENSVTIAIKHIQDEIVPPKELVPELPDSVNNVILKLTKKKPEDRYQNMDELMEDAELILDDVNAAVGEDDPTAPFMGTSLLSEESLFKVEPVDTAAAEEIFEDDDDYEEESFVKTGHKKRRNIIIASILVLLVLTGSVVAMSGLFSKTVKVPDIKNMTVAEATTALTNVKLKIEVEKEVYSNDVESGKIVTQNPESGKDSKEGKTVKVTVSRGTQNVSVPSVEGKTEKEAVAAIEAAKLVVGEIKREYNSNYDPGVVYDINPATGVSVAEGSSITLYVSKGADTVSVPGLVGLSESDARSRISSYGLSVGTVTTQESDYYAAGVVISQSPAEGTETEKNTAVNFVVSSGKPAPTPTPTPAPTPTPTPTTPETPNENSLNNNGNSRN